MNRGIREIVIATLGIVTAAELSASAQKATETVFAMTNAASRNEVLEFNQSADGHFYEPGSHVTHGRGSGGITDPLQSQGSLTLSRDHALLFAANAGSGTVSVFRVSGDSLSLIDQVASGLPGGVSRCRSRSLAIWCMCLVLPLCRDVGD